MSEATTRATPYTLRQLADALEGLEKANNSLSFQRARLRDAEGAYEHWLESAQAKADALGITLHLEEP